MPRPTHPAAVKAAAVAEAEAERQITLSVADSSSGHGVFQPALIRSLQANEQSNLESVMTTSKLATLVETITPSEMLCWTTMRSYMLATCLTRTLPVPNSLLRSCLIRYYTCEEWDVLAGMYHLSHPSHQTLPFYPLCLMMGGYILLTYFPFCTPKEFS